MVVVLPVEVVEPVVTVEGTAPNGLKSQQFKKDINNSKQQQGTKCNGKGDRKFFLGHFKSNLLLSLPDSILSTFIP